MNLSVKNDDSKYRFSDGSGAVLAVVVLYNKALNLLAPIGRMSLSNYIIQSILGSFIYYGFGLGMYQFTGATHCLIIGICLAILQGIFSTWWLNVHKQGPLESLWHKATWVGRQD